MRRRYTIAGLLLIAITAFFYGAFARKPEPVYAGKTVEQWLNAGQDDACLALHEIGPPALPYIMAKLATEDPRYGTSNGYRRLWIFLPMAFRQVLPKPAAANYDETRACTALMELGPKIIPDLARQLCGKNPAVRSVSAQVLGLWRERGKSIVVAVPRLQAALHDRSLHVALSAARALGPVLVLAHE